MGSGLRSLWRSSSALLTERTGARMTDNVPVQKDGSQQRGTAPGADGVSDAAAQTMDPVALGVAFARTHHVLQLEFGDHRSFEDPRRE